MGGKKRERKRKKARERKKETLEYQNTKQDVM